MDWLSSFLTALRSVWDTVYAQADAVMNLRLFLASLVVFLVASVLFETVGNILRYVLLAFIGSSVYFILLSVDVVAQSAYGPPAALIVAGVAILVRMGAIWGKARWPGRIFAAFVILGLFFAVLGLIGAALPGFTPTDQVGAVLTRTAEFVRQLFSWTPQGARVIR